MVKRDCHGTLCQVKGGDEVGQSSPGGGGIPPAVDSYKLVKQASDRYRRAGARLERARTGLRKAEIEMADARRELKLAIDAVQPALPMQDHGPEVPGL